MQRSTRFLLMAALLAGGMSLTTDDAHAAQSYANCSDYIDSLPATIASPGTFCLRKDLSSAQANGRLINITSDDVTIDCNDFKIGGLAAGTASTATAISAGSVNKTTVRNCNIRGFNAGINLVGGGGHLVEDNRLDNILTEGIHIEGNNSNVNNNNVVRRNVLIDTGVGTPHGDVYGIYAEADVIDNTIAGLGNGDRSTSVYGVYIYGIGALARDNTIRGMKGNNNSFEYPGRTYGIFADSARIRLEGNHVVGGEVTTTMDFGIIGAKNFASFCIGNTVASFVNGIGNCHFISGNASY